MIRHREELSFDPPFYISVHVFSLNGLYLIVNRSLIRRLEKIDPREMKHDEQLSFWINIHNALVMHVCHNFNLITR